MTIASTPSFIISGSGLDYPFGIAFDNSGNLWVSNTNNNTVGEFSRSGTFLQAITTGLGPYGIAFDQSENLWVANFGDPINPNVQVIDTTTGVVDQTIPAPPDSAGLAVDASGNIWLSSVGRGGLVFKYTDGPEFEPGLFAAFPGFNYDLEFDASGNLWISDYVSNTVKEFSTDGTLMRSLSAGFSGPTGLAFDQSGNLWVANNISDTDRKSVV